MRRLALVLLVAAGCYGGSLREPHGYDRLPLVGPYTPAPRSSEWPAEGTGPAPSLRADRDEYGCRQIQVARSSLKGGELDDNDRFGEYLGYRGHVAARVDGKVHELDVSERVTLRVLDAEGRPAPGARVIVRDMSGQPIARRTTYADGRALFFPRSEPSQEDEWIIEATLGDAQARKVISRGTSDQAITLRLDGERPSGRPALDVVFCLDCTGSMGDEIDALKRTIDGVARRLGQLDGNPRVRLGLVKYKDRCDEYVVEKDDLGDLSKFRSALAKAQAGGGGDYPEDVQAGLAAAVDDESWDRSSRAARLVFLIGDAPPHLYPDEQSYKETIRHAQEKGVKICSLAASGLDDAGEFVWRQLAQATLGRFIFISYGTPDGGRGTPHHTGPYLENDLGDIVFKQCARELEALTQE